MSYINKHRAFEMGDEDLAIEVIDKPAASGATHRYDITGFDTKTNPSATKPDGYSSHFSRSIILFQNGVIPEVGRNGITHESLIAILIDRLEGFQSGPFACDENSQAIHHLNEALNVLQKRTRDRMNRGVEGTHIK